MFVILVFLSLLLGAHALQNAPFVTYNGRYLVAEELAGLGYQVKLKALPLSSTDLKFRYISKKKAGYLVATAESGGVRWVGKPNGDIARPAFAGLAGRIKVELSKSGKLSYNPGLFSGKYYLCHSEIDDSAIWRQMGLMKSAPAGSKGWTLTSVSEYQSSVQQIENRLQTVRDQQSRELDEILDAILYNVQSPVKDKQKDQEGYELLDSRSTLS